jgi:hypothetical protein
MLENLEAYLQEINEYLAVKQGGDEILAEIRSHILEKAERESGAATKESVQWVIDSYGRPRDVAEKYIEGSDIIAPAFRKHLFRYTWVLFAVHAALTVVALAFHMSFIMFPFFFIPRMPVLAALVYLPMAWLADFGLVAFVLYIVTQKSRSLSLPWLRIFRARPEARQPKAPRPAVFVLLLAILAVVVAVFLRYHTLFFYSVNLHAPEPLMNQAASIFLSLMVLAALVCEVIAYGVRFIVNSVWVTLVKSTLILLILWAVWNSPIAVRFKEVPGVDLSYYGGVLVIILIAATAAKLIKDLVLVIRETSRP